MSWSASLKAPATLDQAENGFIVEDFNVSPPYDSLHDEPKSQFERAKEMAEEIANSGIVGDMEDQKFVITMAGHANPNHEPAEGYANDYVTVTVSQHVEVKEAEASEESLDDLGPGGGTREGDETAGKEA